MEMKRDWVCWRRHKGGPVPGMCIYSQTKSSGCLMQENLSLPLIPLCGGSSHPFSSPGDRYAVFKKCYRRTFWRISVIRALPQSRRAPEDGGHPREGLPIAPCCLKAHGLLTSLPLAAGAEVARRAQEK